MADETPNTAGAEGQNASNEAPQTADAPAPKAPAAAPGGGPARSGGGARRDDRGGGGGRGRGGGRGDRGGDRRGGRGRRREEREERDDEFADTLVPGGVYRCSATVKGGRRLSFGAIVVVGNSKGQVGVGYGKAKEVPVAIQKAIKNGRQAVIPFPLVGDGTIPHEVRGRYGAAQVVLVPAGPGTGIIAGSTVKTVLELGGVHNVLTKSFGSNNRKNLVKATMNALEKLRSREQVADLRGVELEVNS